MLYPGRFFAFFDWQCKCMAFHAYTQSFCNRTDSFIQSFITITIYYLILYSTLDYLFNITHTVSHKERNKQTQKLMNIHNEQRYRSLRAKFCSVKEKLMNIDYRKYGIWYIMHRFLITHHFQELLTMQVIFLHLKKLS